MEKPKLNPIKPPPTESRLSALMAFANPKKYSPAAITNA